MNDKHKDEQLKRELDLQLDRELEATFPASDALKITRNAPAVPKPRIVAEEAREQKPVAAPRKLSRN